MIDLPSAALEYLVADASHAGLLLDFDGVLSSIVDRPEESTILPGNSELLKQIAGRLSAVGVLSGRATASLRERVGPTTIPLIGSYGLEDTAEIAAWVPVIRAASDELEATLGTVQGVLIEHKAVTVAVHWRLASSRARAEARITDVGGRIAERLGLTLVNGKFLIELRPPLKVDKGTALKEFVVGRGLRKIVYVGDDEGDEPAMRAAADFDGHALLVDHGSETSRRLRGLASEVFDGVEGFQRWLRRLAAELNAGDP